MTERDALKLALEALEAHADIGIKADKAITAIREALAQPEHEPTRSQKMRDAGITRRPKGWDKDGDEPEWVGLTDEEIDKLPWGPHEGNPMTFAEGLRDFARAIEAKLMEKNK